MIIEEQTQKRGYKTDGDVSELYLGRRGLKEVPDLSRFRLLKYLWLNHNKISKVNFLGNNFRMAELYLNGNKLCDITGSLKHLTSLHTLMLNDNRLTDLQATVKELKGMTNLRVLNLFQNPLEQDPGYRHCVIHHLPSVQLLDREHVTQKEKEEAFQLYNPHRTAVIQSLGFGRRTDSVLGSRPAAQSSTAHRSSKSRVWYCSSNLLQLKFSCNTAQDLWMRVALVFKGHNLTDSQDRMEDSRGLTPPVGDITFLLVMIQILEKFSWIPSDRRFVSCIQGDGILSYGEL
ncbi:leucine-rich repeat-containing protein 72 isoform X2 [Hyla sarda]|nr:leucine-rich repeat-containing protein 72 isoform X2 [Hyla sarda]